MRRSVAPARSNCDIVNCICGPLDRERVAGPASRLRHALLGDVARQDARAAEDHDRRLDAVRVLHELGLEKLELHAYRPQLLAQQEGGVRIGEAIRAFRAVVQRGRNERVFRVLTCGGKVARRQLLSLIH